MNTRTKGVPISHTPAVSSARKIKRRPRHIYNVEDGLVAAEMGVQVRSLCGVWVWPRRVHGPHWFNSADVTVAHCKRCARVIAADERKYGKPSD